jgi:multicomponent Na+:H+ antiporter subunit D
MRRILAYAIINQVGFMVVAAGIGNEEAINGATAAAFCHILYKSLLWMVTGAVLYRVGKSNLSELGGMRHSMPLTTIFCCIGALSMAAPGTCGFTSKTMIIHAAEYKEELAAWLILELCSVGIFLAAALRMPYYLFFGKDRGIRVKEAPKTMIAAMSLLAFLCILFGVYPQPLYDLLPHGVDFHPYKPAHLTIVLQWLVFTGIAFAIFRARLAPKAGKLVDFDWFYRKGSQSFYQAADRSLNAVNAASAKFFIGTVAKGVSNFLESGGARTACLIMTPVWMMQRLDEKEVEDRRQAFFRQSKRGAFPIGVTAFFAVILLGMLSVIFLVER